MDQNKKAKKLNILYRVVPMICGVVIAFYALCPIKVSAGDFYYDTFVINAGSILGNSYFDMYFPQKYVRMTVRDLVADKSILNTQETFNIGIPVNTFNVALTESTSYVRFYLQTRPFGSHYLRLADIPVGSQFVYFFDHELSIPGTFAFAGDGGVVTSYFTVRYYDVDRNEVGKQFAHNPKNYDLPEVLIANNTFYIEDELTLTLEYPENAVYMQVLSFITMQVLFEPTSYNIPGFNCNLMQNDARLVIAEPGTPDEVIDQIIDLNNKQNQMLNNQNTIINGTPSQNQAVSGSLEGFKESDQKLDDLTEDLKVDTPVISGEDITINNIIDPVDMQTMTAPLTALMEAPLILKIIIAVMTLVIISWVLFGKKG